MGHLWEDPEAAAMDFLESGDASSRLSPRHMLSEFLWFIPFVLVLREAGSRPGEEVWQ